MQNNWLFTHETTLNRVRRILVEMEYLPIFQDYPLKTIQGLFNGFEVEVARLQKEVDSLKEENNKLRRSNEKLSRRENAGK